VSSGTTTLAERKAAALARVRAAVGALCESLAAFAPTLQGRYWLFGSAARGTLRPGSDVDLLLDFLGDGATRLAWDRAEAECRHLGLIPDIMPIAACDPAFLAHVLPTARALG